MGVIIIVVVLAIVGVVAGVLVARSKSAAEPAASPQTPAAARPPKLSDPVRDAGPAPAAQARPPRLSDPAPSARPSATAPPPDAPTAPVAAMGDEPTKPDEPDLSRFTGRTAPADPIESFADTVAAPAPTSATARPRPMLEGDLAPTAVERVAPVEPDQETIEPPEVPVSADAAQPLTSEPFRSEIAPLDEQPAFDLERVIVAPIDSVTDGDDGPAEEPEHDVATREPADDTTDDATDEAAAAPVLTASTPEHRGEGATVTRLEPRTDDVVDPPLAAVVADLIDAADPEVAHVMAQLIDASDPDLVAQLVDADNLAVAEVVAQLVDAADPRVRSLVLELADAPERREVAEVLRLVDASYSGDGAATLSPDIAEKLEDLDIEADLELTSRPAEMAQFARLDNKDQLRVIIRVLCGLVAREDLPRSPRMPAAPASSAENRRWPLSRARWPVPPPEDEDIVKRAPLPARPTSSKAS